jgi:hypothetical protein
MKTMTLKAITSRWKFPPRFHSPTTLKPALVRIEFGFAAAAEAGRGDEDSRRARCVTIVRCTRGVFDGHAAAPRATAS